MAYYYLKLYHEILDDPKMGMLPDHLYRRVIEVFLIASASHERDGFLPSVIDMSWKLRTNPDDLQADLTEIENRTGIVKQIEGRWHVTNFIKRQSAVSGSERIKRYREREHTSNETLPSRYTELKLNIESESELNKSNDNNGSVFTHFQNEISLLTPKTSEIVGGWIDDYPQDWIISAIDEAVKNNARKPAYIDAILKRWKVNGKSDKSKPPTQPSIYDLGYTPVE